MNLKIKGGRWGWCVGGGERKGERGGGGGRQTHRQTEIKQK